MHIVRLSRALDVHAVAPYTVVIHIAESTIGAKRHQHLRMLRVDVVDISRQLIHPHLAERDPIGHQQCVDHHLMVVGITDALLIRSYLLYQFCNTSLTNLQGRNMFGRISWG